MKSSHDMKASSSAGSFTGMLVRMWEEEAESREAVRLKYHRGIGEDDQPVYQSQVPRNSEQSREQSPTRRSGRHHHHHHHRNSARQQQQPPRPEVIYEADEELDDDGGGGGRGHHHQQVAVVVVSSV